MLSKRYITQAATVSFLSLSNKGMIVISMKTEAKCKYDVLKRVINMGETNGKLTLHVITQRNT